MSKPYKNAVRKHPQAVILKEWIPNSRPDFDFEWFETTDARATFFDEWCDECVDSEHPVVIAEILDTATMTLGRIVSLPAESAAAKMLAAEVAADPTLLFARRTTKTKANISWLTDTLATGGDFAFLDDVMLEQLEDLLAQEITLVVDCREEESDQDLWGEVAAIHQNAPTYLHLPTNDADGWSIPPEHFEAAITAVAPVLGRGERVFIHCHMGVNRGPSTAYAVLLSQGRGITEAFDMIRAARPTAGISYAEDALQWWANNQAWSQARTKEALAELASHIDRVLGPAQTRVVERAVRKLEKSDHRQITEIAI